MSNIGPEKEKKHWTRFYQINCDCLYGVFSDSEIDTDQLETKLVIINFTRLDLLIVGIARWPHG